MDRGFVVPPGQGKVWNMAPGGSAALKVLNGQTAESVMMFEEVAPAETETLLHRGWAAAGDKAHRMAASHFECDDLYASYGHHWLQRAEAVIAPVGEALPNTEIFRRLAARFSFTDACFGASDRPPE